MSKTKKIIYFIISATLCICLFAVSVSAQSYEFKDTTILTEDTLLRVSNGKDYSKKYTPSTYIDHNENSGNENDLHGENYAMVQYSIKDYNPPTGGEYDTLTTCVYLRLNELKGISVAKGKRLIIKFKLKYEGTRAFDGLTTRVAIKGWNSSVRKNFGYVPRNSISEFELIWDNKSGNCSIDYFDICFLLYSNANPSGSWIFWFLYDSLKVTVEDIPISKQDIINNQNENTDKIIDNQNQNTDKEIQAEKDQYELEKQEAQKSGDESVDGALSAMPNDSDGIISSFDNLLSCMLHTNTNCNITFPELKTPAICGIPSYTVSKKVMFGIDQIPQYIPNSILYLVRALLTIALILYCYKELYSTIQYIVSLKKGGTDE